MIRILKKLLRPIKIYIKKKKNTKFVKKSMLCNNETNIIFLCQCEYIFNKTRNVFKELKDRNVKTSLYIVKDELSVNSSKTTIFENEFPNDCYFYENVKLSDLKPSLVIYTRPYDVYLPEELKSYNVQKFSKIGYIPYYFSLEKEFGLNDDLFMRLNYFFADTEEHYEYFNKFAKKNIKKGLQHSFNLGYPVFDTLLKQNGENIFKNKKAKKVIWTPRWTTDLKLGGSNFLRYKDEMFNLFINNPKYSFVFRPHPMLFSNCIKKGLITQNEKNELISKFDLSTNACYDTRSDYIDTFNASDILITDYSAIVVEYFLTGKPMIYCYNESELIFSKDMNNILNCSYVAYSFEDILNYLTMLEREDPKKNLRTQYIDEFKKKNYGATQRIVSVIEKL